MNIDTIVNYQENYWYRGFKSLHVKKYTTERIEFSNGDIIKIYDGEIYLNNKLICSDIETTAEQFLELYKYILVKKGYKFIN